MPGRAGSSSDGVPKATALTGLATGKASFKPSALIQEEQFSKFQFPIYDIFVFGQTPVLVCVLYHARSCTAMGKDTMR